MKKFNLSMRWWIICAVLFFPSLMHAQVLKGKLDGFLPENGSITYSPDGNIFNSITAEININNDGYFIWDAQLPVDAVDASIDFGVEQTFGVHLTKGKTMEMNITKTGKEYQVKFKGYQADISYWINRSAQAFNMSRYLFSDPSFSIQERELLLENEYKNVLALLPKIKDPGSRNYYTRLSEAKYKWLKLRLLMDETKEKSIRYSDTDEFKQLTQGVDINDPINAISNLSLLILNAKITKEMKGNNEDYCREQMAIVDRYVTLPALRSQMIFMIASNYFIYGDGSGDYRSFTHDFLKFAGKDSTTINDLVKPFLMKHDAMQRIKPGAIAPDITLNTADNQNIQLASLLKGKFTYIDVWATWCGPCTKEIPYLEKLVDKYQGNDKIQFISISIDNDKEAWEKKIETDHPQWKQYILTKENSKKFQADWGINGIPRFIMIDANGHIFSGDAPRPSDNKTDNIIEEQIK